MQVVVLFTKAEHCEEMPNVNDSVMFWTFCLKLPFFDLEYIHAFKCIHKLWEAVLYYEYCHNILWIHFFIIINTQIAIKYLFIDLYRLH